MTITNELETKDRINSNRFLFALIVGVLTTIALLAFNLYGEYHLVIDHTKIELENITQVLDEEALSTFNKADFLLLEIQRNVQPEDMRLKQGVNNFRSQKLHGLMKSQSYSMPDVDMSNIVDSKGNYIYSSLDSVPAINVTDSDYFKTQKENANAGLVISPPLISHRTGKWTIILSRRLNFEDGSFAGIVISELNLNYFERFYSTLDLGPYGVVALFDKDLRLAERFPMLENARGKIAKLPVQEYIQKGVSHAVFHNESPLNGIERMSSFRNVGNLGFIVFASIAADDYLAEWQQRVWSYSIGAMLIIMIATWFGLKHRRSEQALHAGYLKSKRDEETIVNMAFYDALTNLPNRRLLLDRFQQALNSSVRSGKHGAIMLIDLDNFKTLNDTQGHVVGDHLLCQVAQRLKTCVRECDTVARLGGDEFVVLVVDIGQTTEEAMAAIEMISEKILASLGQPFQLESLAYICKASGGVTLFNGDEISVTDLLKQADLAMYKAKDSGRNICRFFDPSMEAAIHDRMMMEKALQLAIAEKQFQLFYQPQVGGDGQLFGVEALIRWIHPLHGPIQPDNFIPLAEETGLILPLGQWVLETACAQLVAWKNQPKFENLTIAVNVSAKQFHHPNYVNQVLTTIDHSGADPRKLKLELTESLLLDNIEEVIAKMTVLKAKGLSFSLDDFGTGYSSLSYLSRLPLDQIKIDRSFVMDIESNDDSFSICSSIISMAHNLDMKVVAEGVENETQNYILNSGQRCDYFQGYLFSKPVPIGQFEALLKRADFQVSGQLNLA